MIDPDRLEIAVQIGAALLNSQGCWPQTEADKQLWADTAVEMADALLTRLGDDPGTGRWRPDVRAVDPARTSDEE